MSTATFVAKDLSTHGNWTSPPYGGLGYSKLEGATPTVVSSFPSGLTIATSDTPFANAVATGDTNALTRVGSGTRDDCFWYSLGAVSQTITPSDGTTRRMRAYFYDASNARSATITVKDGVGTVLDTQTLSQSDYHNGAWFSWDVTGTIVLTATLVGGSNVVSQGIFLDTPGGGGALTAGALAYVSSGTAGIAFTASTGSGGTPTIAQNLQRSTTTGSGFSDLSGLTGTTPVDATAVVGTLYYYRVRYTDSAGSPATVYSAEVTAKLYLGGDFGSGSTAIILFH